MAVITFQYSDGRSVKIEASQGKSVMQLAKIAGLEGIIAECGGGMVCATCHVYIKSEDLLARFPPVSAIEEEMLDFTSEPRRENSRLSCQLPVSESIDGLVVEIPRTQV
jgi:ferredoxin, 2Fe-2S